MKNKIMNMVIILAVWVCLPNMSSAEILDVNIYGLKNSNGQVLVYLYDNADSFPTHTDEAVLSVTVTIVNKTAKAKFSNVVSGLYAVAVVHDENGDGKVNTNFIGRPKEGVGSSNSIRDQLGRPKFDDASFKLKSEKSLLITVNYH